MDDWLHEYEKQMRDWRNLEYQKKLDDRLEWVRRVLDSRHPEYKKRHHDMEKEAASRELPDVLRCRIRLSLKAAGIFIVLAVIMILLGYHPIVPIGACFWISFSVYKSWKELKSVEGRRSIKHRR